MESTNTPYTKRLRDLLGTADGQQTYLTWLADETTQLMLNASRELARPSRPSDNITALIKIGETLGANGILDFMTAPHQAAATAKAAPVLDRSYGAPDMETLRNS